MKPSSVYSSLIVISISVALFSDLVASDVLPVPGDCTKYQVCDYSGCFVFNCGPGTEFNPKINVCDYALQDRTSCGARQNTGLGPAGADFGPSAGQAGPPGGPGGPGGPRGQGGFGVSGGPGGPGGPVGPVNAGPIGGGVPVGAVQCPGACGSGPSGGGSGASQGGGGSSGGYRGPSSDGGYRGPPSGDYRGSQGGGGSGNAILGSRC